MEFVALGVWLCVCLLLGALMHYVMAGALEHRLVQLLAAPGMIVRKLSMALVALVSGGTVTRVSIYELSTRDVNFQGEGIGTVSKVLVPLGPIFAGAVTLGWLNTLFGAPLHFDYVPPSLASLDSGGARQFAVGTYDVVSGAFRQFAGADWGSPKLYLLLLLCFSLALGACEELARLKEAVLGVVLLCLGLALTAAMTTRHGPVGLAHSPAWLMGGLDAIRGASATAFVLMVYGLAASVAVGIVVRASELLSGGAASSRAGKTAKPAEKEERRRAA